ncbi:MAG: TlyA family RNA methyltransferase [Deltaproteobacteria bacterium]|nr:TlyA family RNA methyltransferase [Deltaproteobacteria bacterium]
MNSKVRLDNLLVQKGMAPSLERAQALIMAGSVLVKESVVDKAGALVSPEAAIRIKGADLTYVSRGGVKLKGALDNFRIAVRDLVVLDVGASTGGFTDCLLQEGAAKVYALDVSYGQLAWKLRDDPRVVPIERANIRYFTGEGIAENIGLATIDASFISLTLVIPAVLKLIAADASVLALIKPQFEVGKNEVGRRGVVNDPALHRRVIEEITGFCQENDLEVAGVCESKLAGPAGNKEFFIHARR